MYNYDFLKENEQTIFEQRLVYVEISDKTYEESIIITDKNILLFSNLNKNNVLTGQAMVLPSEYVLDLKIPKKEMKFKIQDNDTFIEYKDIKLIIYDLDISNYMS